MSQIYLSENAIADHPADDGRTQEIIVDLAYRHLVLVNVVFVGQPKAGDGNWILVDAGLVGSASEIMSCAEARFGGAGRPAAILMTHGHFDHVGALESLAGEWDVPVYAHRLEMPYLNGRRSYPPPDAAAGGGLISAISPLFPRSPVNVANRLYELPDDQSVPYMPGWKWIHTPGHCPGHVSFWREADRSLIVGDAFITTKQESAYAAIAQPPEMHGPPMYFTPDWQKAKESVQLLASLSPDVVITGHGQSMRGSEMREALEKLASMFDKVAVPHT